MIDTKLVSIWQVAKYLLDGWELISFPIDGEVYMQRITLIKGEANETLINR